VTTRQKPDHLEVPRRGGILRSNIPFFSSSTLKCLQTVAMCPIPRLMALEPNCFAGTRESPCNVESISRKPYNSIDSIWMAA